METEIQAVAAMLALTATAMPAGTATATLVETATAMLAGIITERLAFPTSLQQAEIGAVPR